MAAVADPPEAPAKRITPLEPRPPSMAPGLGTIGGVPTDADSPAKPADAEATPAQPQTPTPIEPRPQSMAPGLGTAGGAPIDQKPSATEDPRVQAIPEAKKPAESTKKPEDPRVEAVPEKPQPAEDPRVEAIQPPPAQTQPQPPAPQPQPEKPAEPQPQPPADDRDAKIQALVKGGKTPGEAQAIVDGQQPKTLNGQTPPKAELVDPDPDKRYLDYLARTQGYRPGMAPWEQETAPTTPEQQAHKPIDTLKADDKNRVDPVSLYSYLLGKFANSGLVGYVPPDGARWGIKTGSAAEWAAFGLAVAKQESDLNTRSYNAADPGGSAGLFQFGQGQKPYVQGDQFDPQQSADAFVRSVQHYLANKGRVADMGEIFGSIRRPNEAGRYIAGAQKVAAGGSGKDLVSSGGGGGGGGGGRGGGGGGGGGSGDDGLLFNVPFQQGYNPPPQQPLSFDAGGGGRTPDYREAPTQSDAGSLNLGAIAGAALAGTAAGSLLRGGERQAAQQATQPSEEKGPSPSDVVSRVLAAGGPPPAPGAAPVDLSTMKPANVLGVRTVGAPQLGLPAPPAAPSAAPAAPDPIVIKGLMKRGFTREQALAFAAKASVSKPGAALTGGASFRKPLQLPAPPPAPSPQPPAAAKPQPQVPAVKPQAPPRPVSSQPPVVGVAPRGSTVGVPNPPGGPSPDDPRVKKQKDNLTKGEHFVTGDDFHDQLLAGLPGGHGGRQRQLLGQAEEAIAEKRPMHISYISAPKEAEKFPTRESRTIQYEAHSPEARLMGTTEGQLVGHSFIPTAVGVSPSRKAGEPHQSYIQGISTNVIANNFAHLNTKLAAMGLKTPYARFGPKFANDLEGYLHNLNAGHTGTGRGYALGTAEYPNEPDTSHVPYKLTRHEADFLNTVINNTGAFAKHEDAKALRELARVNGTLITPQGETNRMRHQIEQQEPGWRQRVLEPSIRSFKTGLVHEIHPSEEHMPATIRPGQDYRDVTQAMQRTSERGRPDVPVAVSLHHTFADNKAINQIERDFSEERISEADARARLHALGEDPDQYRFVGGSGGLITPYEENPEAITPEEHTQLKDNLRKQWIGGKMPIEDYRRKTAEVPLPEKPSTAPSGTPATTPEPEESETPEGIPGAQPKLSKPVSKGEGQTINVGGHDLPRNSDGTVTLYHATKSHDNAERIVKEKTLRSVSEPSVYLSTAPSGTGYGEHVVSVNVHPKHLQLDDEFPNGRADFRIDKKVAPVSAASHHQAPTEPSAEEPAAEPPAPVKQRGFKAYKEPPSPAPSVPAKPEPAAPEEPEAKAPPEAPEAEAAAKAPPLPRPISPETQKVLGPQPTNKKQAALWQQAGERLDTQVPEGIPLEVDRGEKGKFKTDPKGKVLYKKTNYDIANSPLLQKQGKALGQALNKKTGKIGMAKPPAETEDDLESLDPEKRLTPFLNPTDRKRVAHLNDVSAVDAYADELHKMYKGIQDLPEVMKGKNWYDEAVDLLRQHFGTHADLMANLLGATSAGNKVKINFNMAIDAYHQFLRGHYDDAIRLYNQAYDLQQIGKGALMKHVADNGIHAALGQEAPDTDERAMLQWIEHHNLTPRSSKGKLFGHNSLQVLKVLAHNWEKEAGGPKTPNFAANLNGRSMQATIDMWAARTMRRLGFEGHTDQPWMIQPAGETGVHNVDFGLSQLAFKKAADKIGIKPSALQAILWFAEQKEWQKRGWEREQDPDERDYRPMIRKYQRPGDITQEQAGKYHPSVPELKARLAGGAGGVLKMQGGGVVPSLMTLGATDQQPPSPLLGQTTAPRATPVETTPAPRAEPPPAPGTPVTPASNWDQILQNAAPKYTGQPGGKTTVFATPKDLRDWEVHHSYKTGDNGVGSPALGSVDTAASYGLAVPEDVMTKLYGGKASDPSTTANWRTARAQVTVNGKTYVVPISDLGPAGKPDNPKTPLGKGYVTDLTSDFAKGAGWMSDDSDGPVQIKLLPPGSGPDYLTDRKGWQAEQENIGKQLTPTPLGSSDIVNPLQYQNPAASGQTPD